MSGLVLERHVFYVEAERYQGNPMRSASERQEQTHLWMKTRRLPVTPGHYAVYYMTPGQLAGQPSRGETDTARMFHLENIRQMRAFLLGEREAHNRVIVAKIINPEQEILTREQMGALFFKTRTGKFQRTHRPHLPPPRRDEAWFIFDPSRPGHQIPSRDTWLRDAKSLFNRTGKEVVRGMAEGTKNRRKVFTEGAVVIVGAAYRLVYYGGSKPPPADVVYDNRVENRVNKFLSATSRFRRGFEGEEEWYAMGKSDVPVRSKRRPSTVTWKHGRGLVPVSDTEERGVRPLLVVRARTSSEAKERATMKIRQIGLKNRHRAAVLYGKWLDAGKLMLPRRSVAMMLRAKKAR